MKNWTYQDQMDFEMEIRDSVAATDYRKIGSRLYVMDTQYDDYKEEPWDEVCDSFFEEF